MSSDSSTADARPTRYRTLRIAWSVVWGVVAVLLVALWVRSCYRADTVGFIRSKVAVAVFSNRGTVACSVTQLGFPNTWILENTPIEVEVSPYKYPWIYVQPLSTSITTPNWLLVTLFSGVAVVPWIRFSTRYSLRTLLIALTVVAVGLGLIVWANR